MTQSPVRSNLIPLAPGEYLPRWRWDDLEILLTAALPARRRQLRLLISSLKSDALNMTSQDVMEDLVVIVRALSETSNTPPCDALQESPASCPLAGKDTS